MQAADFLTAPLAAGNTAVLQTRAGDITAQERREDLTDETRSL